MFKEFQQLNNGPMPGKPVLGPINNEALSIEDRKKSLAAVNLIKENDVERSRRGHVLMGVYRKSI